MLFCINLPNFIYIGPDLRRSNDVVSIFNMVAAAAQYYFRFCICWRRCLQNVKIYPPPKFGRHGSIHGWDIVTSVSEKQTSAILEFYFRFPFRPYCRNPHTSAKFHTYRSTQCRNMTSYRFLPRDAMHKRGLCRHAVSVRLSVTFVDHVKTNTHIS